MTQEINIDRIDISIIRALLENGRATHASLAEEVALSSTAIARRQRLLEDAGIISGYSANLDLAKLGLGTTVVVKITLDSQSEDALDAFERAIAASPSVVRCLLMSGTDDYIVTLRVESLADYDRIHRTELSRLPRVSRMESSFAMREIVARPVPLALLETRQR